ncbi:DNA polymerase III subunit epsilon [Thermochromatium tepidum]|uniref:DNA polymerase III subunit epsilon n=1 Tax=Thermochromatium tepidum ATCC 43061 TaxID=316276 RepID=A0A6I6EAR7_THETI|nr:DNA polymerase III subunit epsilon [Thermochromatium tepidum]QGU33708.1 DNA polymerase III subunit epsilon [Thermochromatium tepidum ATCC 43061]
MRQIVLDTETTGLDPREGHRIIEIGGVELIDRRPSGHNFHEYINPERQIDAEAETVHGISNALLADKPRFADIAERLIEYLRGAELIIHNAAFDVGFLDYEFSLWRGSEAPQIADLCTLTDTLTLARRLHPGQRNGLDALCKRYGIDNSHRTLHGALLDAQILADVYLAMTGGQVALYLDGEGGERIGDDKRGVYRGRVDVERPRLRVVRATPSELEAHQTRLKEIQKASGSCVWLGALG